MQVLLEIPDDKMAEIEKQAVTFDMSVDGWLLKTIFRNLPTRLNPSSETVSTRERMQRFLEPRRDFAAAPPLPESAFHRETMYDDQA